MDTSEVPAPGEFALVSYVTAFDYLSCYYYEFLMLTRQ